MAYLKQHMQGVPLPCLDEALAGLALLECDVPREDSTRAGGRRFAAGQASGLTRTYELPLPSCSSTASATRAQIAFSHPDRRPEPEGRLPTAPELHAARARQATDKPRRLPSSPYRPAWFLGPLQHSVRGAGPVGGGRHGINVAPLARAANVIIGDPKHGRGLGLRDPTGSFRTLANTCSALLGPGRRPRPQFAGGRGCAPHRRRPSGERLGCRGGARVPGPFSPAVLCAWSKRPAVANVRQVQDLYALWSVERVAALYDLKTPRRPGLVSLVALVLSIPSTRMASWYRIQRDPIDTAFALLMPARAPTSCRT